MLQSYKKPTFLLHQLPAFNIKHQNDEQGRFENWKIYRLAKFEDNGGTGGLQRELFNGL